MPNKSGKTNIDERLLRIVDEITMAARWQRPLLVTATCRSEITSRAMETQLVEALRENGHTILPYQVNKIHYDIPIELKQHPLHNQGIFMVRNLRQGGGPGYSNAYRALNMHREYLVEAGIKAIFWLSETEGRQLARFAPDFWSFRHMVVAFPEFPSSPSRLEANTSQHRTNPEDWLRKGEELFALGCYEDALRSYRQSLRRKPSEALILLKIARVQLAMHAINPARRTLKLAFAGKLTGKVLLQEYFRLESLLKSEQDTRGGFLEG